MWLWCPHGKCSTLVQIWGTFLEYFWSKYKYMCKRVNSCLLENDNCPFTVFYAQCNMFSPVFTCLSAYSGMPIAICLAFVFFAMFMNVTSNINFTDKTAWLIQTQAMRRNVEEIRWMNEWMNCGSWHVTWHTVENYAFTKNSACHTLIFI